METKNRLTWKEWTSLGVAALALGALGFHMASLSKPAPGDWGKAPAFRYEDRNGGTLRNTDLKGKFWVADFIFTRCAGSCPILSQQMRRLQERWKGNDKLALVSFTVDPDYDTVAVLKGYADDLDADPKQWFFLTGAKKDLLRTAEDGFHLTAIENPGAEPGALFIHSTKLVLVGPEGTILGYYDGTDKDEFNKLRAELKSLLG
ncbi:MAG TPA: SCO family protein [bacterium]|nr:SCO family protein [bacterium]